VAETCPEYSTERQCEWIGRTTQEDAVYYQLDRQNWLLSSLL